MKSPQSAFWNGKRVLVTGHTGFKGGWLCLWLQSMGAEVHGFALPAPAGPNLFEVAGVHRGLKSSNVGDIRNYEPVLAVVQKIQPEIVLHMAAQPLVRLSYQRPVETYAANVMGTVHLLEAVRATEGVRVVVNVTSDKCYENREWPWSYRETEAMGGSDPYSSSKGCAELVTAAYRRSFLAGSNVAVATARAGNVIGGGDWAPDRLLPDLFRALDSGEQLAVRYPHAVRPWQHVLEPLCGYLTLARRLYEGGADVAESWNFGPTDEDMRSVAWVVERVASQCPALTWSRDAVPPLHEAHNLRLDSSKARTRLGWKPRWRLNTALEKTVEWHAAWRRQKDMQAATLAQIADYEAADVEGS